LRPAALESASLAALIDRLGDSLGGQVQIPVDIVVDDVDLPPEVKLAFYRITQEAFSNILKHARARRATAVVRAKGRGATLLVRDDGRGFDPDAVASGHMGLLIMRERLERVGAELMVDSAPGLGTTIRAVWPRPASDDPRLERMGA
jgi:signal transduction histidine kinase